MFTLDGLFSSPSRNCSHGVIMFVEIVNLNTCCKQSKNPTMAWSNLDEMKKKTIKVTLFTTLSRKNISDISLHQLTDSWTNTYKSQIYAFPAWKIKNFLKLFSSLATKICFSFLSVVQLSATLDGRKAKLFAVIVVFVQIVTFYRIWMGWFCYHQHLHSASFTKR